MSELARAMQRKFPSLPPDYVWAICRLHEQRINQRFLVPCEEGTVTHLTDAQLEAAGYEKRFVGGDAGWCWLPIPWYKLLWRKWMNRRTP